jgi:endonuclease/exonuclease/phosphatase family metal-dependent hydrolase
MRNGPARASHFRPSLLQVYERFGDARLDYILVQWVGRGVVLSAEVIDGRLPGGSWGSDHLAVLAELDLRALAGKPAESR